MILPLMDPWLEINTFVCCLFYQGIAKAIPVNDVNNSKGTSVIIMFYISRQQIECAKHICIK